MKGHVFEEQYHRAGGVDEMMLVHVESGTSIYVMARLYILQPDYRVSIGLYEQATKEGVIGEVASADWVGMRQCENGQARAWLYPQERTLVLWECCLENWYRKEDPRTDEVLKAVWLGFEGFLLRHLPAADRIVTPSWEPIYENDREAWPEFLEAVGYHRIGKKDFGKEPPQSPNPNYAP